MSVGLVVVSHSEKIAAGVVELAGQMAGSTKIIAAGGTDDGGIGTSFDKVTAAIAEAGGGGGVVVLCDLGSAQLTAETALELLDDELRSRVRIADGPIVEGAVAAAVAAEIGGDLDAVLAAAQSAGGATPDVVPREPDAGESAGERHPQSDQVSGTATLVNKDGLHARPAADFVKLASAFDAKVTVNGVDAKSLLRIMSLGLTKGSEVSLSASGPDAEAAVSAMVELIESAFGEQETGDKSSG